MPYRILKDITFGTERHPEAELHKAGSVISDCQLSDYVAKRIAEDDPHYLTLFAPLTDEEALEHRATETALEGEHLVDGRWVSPPFPDYVGLAPEEIVDRMRKADPEKVEQTKTYERGGQGRTAIVGFQRGSAETSAESQGASTSPKALRWAASNPGDAQHAAELEDRLTSLETRFAAVEQKHSSSESEAA